MARTSLKRASLNDAAEVFDFLELWRTLQRRRRFIFALTAILFFLAVVYCLVATRKYKSTGVIEVQKAAPDSLGLNSALGIPAEGEDSLMVNLDIQTQINILQSKSLALQVIDEMNLESAPDFKGHFSLNPIGRIMGLLTPKGRPDAKNVPLVDRPNRRDSILATFEGNLKVEEVAGTRLVNISYTSEDPATATAIVNRLMKDLMNSSSKAREARTSGSSQWMEGQLSAIRGESERLQQEVARMQQQAGIVSLGTTDSSGREQTYSAILDQLQQASATLGAAQTNRILKGAVYEAVKTGNAELISGISPSLSATASPSVSNSLGLIQSLRTEEAAEQANLGQLEAKFGSAYPKLEETRMRIAKYDQEIRDEAGRIRDRAMNDYAIAVQAEHSSREAYEKTKKDADAVNNSAMSLAIANEEAESSRKLYQDLLSRSKEAEILEGLRSSGISVVDPAMIPGNPAKPRVPIYLGAAVFLGLSLGSGFALVMDLLGGRIVSVAAAKGEFGASPIGVLPQLTAQELATIELPASGLLPTLPLAIFKLPLSSYSEALRSLAASLLLSRRIAAPRTVMVTSSVANEGKTTLAANLAVLAAQQGQRVLLVDADLREPGLHTLFKMKNGSGLSSVLANPGANAMSEIQAVAAQERLFVLGTGAVSSHPSELLGLPRFGELLEEYRQNFDLVILDAAQLLPFNDPVLVAGYADAVLLVSRVGETKLQELRDSVAKLQEHVAAEGIHLVVNGVDRYSRGHHAFDGGAK